MQLCPVRLASIQGELNRALHQGAREAQWVALAKGLVAPVVKCTCAYRLIYWPELMHLRNVTLGAPQHASVQAAHCGEPEPGKVRVSVFRPQRRRGMPRCSADASWGPCVGHVFSSWSASSLHVWERRVMRKEFSDDCAACEFHGPPWRRYVMRPPGRILALALLSPTLTTSPVSDPLPALRHLPPRLMTGS